MARLQPNKHIPQVLDYEIGTLRSAARGLRQRSSDAGLMHRLDSVLLLIQGLHPRELAHWFGESEKTLDRWKKRFREQGIEGLKNIRHSGRPPKLSPETARKVFDDLAKAPILAGFPTHEWRGKLLQQHLKSCYGVSLSLRQAQRLLHEFRKNSSNYSANR